VTYDRLFCDPSSLPALETPATRRVLSLLLDSAERFAARCRRNPDPRFPHDADRSARLLCAVGLGNDEASGFLRAIDTGLVELHQDGNFTVPGARACSSNLHLVGRERDHVKLHNEVLIHVTAYAELVLNLHWEPGRIVFDPFFDGDALDLWGYESATAAGPSWRDGRITLAAEAKARVGGRDGLNALRRGFDRLQQDPSTPVDKGHGPKWEELVRLTAAGSLDLLLVADGARWWFSAHRDAQTNELRVVETDAPLNNRHSPG
jgi:hypothetical protein